MTPQMKSYMIEYKKYIDNTQCIVNGKKTDNSNQFTSLFITYIHGIIIIYVVLCTGYNFRTIWIHSFSESLSHRLPNVWQLLLDIMNIELIIPAVVAIFGVLTSAIAVIVWFQ